MTALLAIVASPAYVVRGLSIGVAYGLLAVGLVLVYRSSRFVNFAHGEIGAFGAAMLSVCVRKLGVPYWVAVPLAMLLAAALGAASEALIVRRLRHAPTLMSMVATIGYGHVLVVLAIVISPDAMSGADFPRPPGLPSFTIDRIEFSAAHSGLLLLSPLVLLAVVAFLRRTRYGLGIQAAAANPEAASLAGFSPTRMATLAWGLAGAVAAFTAIFFLPTRGFTAGESLGPSLLLRALACGALARMQSLPKAFAAGIGLGVVEQLLLANAKPSLVDVVLCVVILVALLVLRPSGSRERDRGSWTAVEPWPPVPEHLRGVWAIRHLGLLVAVPVALAALAVPVFASNRAAFSLTLVLCIALVGLSLVIVTGVGGQLSLGQVAIAAAGAVGSFHVTSATGNFAAGFLVGAAASAAVAVVVGLPALRIQGMFLAVATLAFAAAGAYVLEQPFALDGGVDPGRPVIAGHALTGAKPYYLFVLVVFGLGALVTRNIVRSGFGRLLAATRDNEDAARAFTVPVTKVKLQAFAVAGALAGLGGASFAHLQSLLNNRLFAPSVSIEVVAATVIGGIGSLAGPLVGALYITGIPTMFDLDAVGRALLQLGWLALVLTTPAGAIARLRPQRDRLVALLARRAGLDPAAAPADAAPAPARLEARAAAPASRDEGAPLLEVKGVVKRYGGLLAVDGVDLEVRAGETLGLIGPNGAGKTTLFELISGFTWPDEGTVRFDGHDVTRLTPERRGRLGLIRSFQEASLFPTMTVLETVMVAAERRRPTSLLHSVAGSPDPDRRKEHAAREVVSLLGLDAYRGRRIGELSTGTRRITEIACLVVLEPTLLLLDEPAAGVAQRETEALGELLAGVKRHLGTTLIVIEHDMPLVHALSDRIVALETGKVIASGTPDEVQRHEGVVRSFLGGDLVAIERSGTSRPRRVPRRATRSSPASSR
jgi:ABC-type branched-subunit amino acid transport system ATPase component/ABC-type branched-subunit amino acid transport system permease subunit